MTGDRFGGCDLSQRSFSVNLLEERGVMSAAEKSGDGHRTPKERPHGNEPTLPGKARFKLESALY
jgi:hypothetical protein